MAFHVVAEVGSNWYAGDSEKSRQQALLCCDQAITAGADIVKFQLFRADTLYSKERAPKLHEKMRNFELPLEWIPDIAETIHDAGREFWLSVFEASLAWDAARYVDGLKVASGDVTNRLLISVIAEVCEEHRKTMAISLGAATFGESWEAIDATPKCRIPRLIVFHCVSAYPARPSDYNLRAGLEFQEDVDAIGISDHTRGYELLAPALALGYTYFEKHFKPFISNEEFRRQGDMPIHSGDWDFSLSFDDFCEYICELRQAEAMLGDNVKVVQEDEKSERLWARRGSDGLRPVDEVKE